MAKETKVADIQSEKVDDQITSSTETACSQCGQETASANKTVVVSTTNADTTAKDNAKPERKPWFTWEHSMDILKVLATVWVALVGSLVTMQFNERQHELNRIEAIAKMLPHISESDTIKDSDDESGTSSALSKLKDGSGSPSPFPSSNSGHTHDMSRDGAIWAIFRTANSKTMLRDLAALFPDDIYRVVSSISQAGELGHDQDALTALQVASEKLATKYSADPNQAELASRLYEQAVLLKQRKPNDESAFHVIDLTSSELRSGPSSDGDAAVLLKSINDLADLHVMESLSSHKISSGHSQAKQLYKRASELGMKSKNHQVQAQVIRADLALAEMFLREGNLVQSAFYLKGAHTVEAEVLGKPADTDAMKKLDQDGDGFASASEIATAIRDAMAKLKHIQAQFDTSKGVPIGDL